MTRLDTLMSADNSAAVRFVAVMLEGNCSINGSDDVPCAMIGLASDSATLMSTAAPAFADEAVLSLPQIGRQKGVVTRAFAGGFEVQFGFASYGKLATYLDWLAGTGNGRPGHEDRRQARLVPMRKLVALERDGEPASMARILDLSRSGVAFTTTRTLEVGEAVAVAGRAGRVARLTQGGAAVRFDEPLPAEGFDVMIDLAAL